MCSYIHITANIDYDWGLTDIFVAKYAEKFIVIEVTHFFNDL